MSIYNRYKSSYTSQLLLLFTFFTYTLVFSTGCKKFVEVDTPVTRLLSDNVYSSDASAMAAQTNVYVKLATQSTSNFSLYPGYSSDEFKNYSAGAEDIQFYTNGLLNNTIKVNNIWADCYRYIYQANAVLEGVEKSQTLSATVKQQLKGEAEFTRAFLYFYLVNLWGDVPLITGTTYFVNSNLERTSKDVVFTQIIKDLQDAGSNLNANYLAADGVTKTTEKLRPTKAAAAALLARVYLYTSDWVNAETQATTVISGGTFTLGSDLTKVFAKNSSEAIWQVSSGPSFNTSEGYIFIPTSTPSNITLSNSLLASFEPNDKRRANWVGTLTFGTSTYLYPFKYRVQYSTTVTEYTMMLRYAEQFLIRAEAYARQGKLTQAIGDINTIRARAGLPALSASLNQAQILTAIEQERNVELFSEWGDRWLNLKRTGRIDAVMAIAATAKGGSWNSNMQLYPIPQSDINANSNLKQNPGY